MFFVILHFQPSYLEYIGKSPGSEFAQKRGIVLARVGTSAAILKGEFTDFAFFALALTQHKKIVEIVGAKDDQ